MSDKKVYRNNSRHGLLTLHEKVLQKHQLWSPVAPIFDNGQATFAESLTPPSVRIRKIEIAISIGAGFVSSFRV